MSINIVLADDHRIVRDGLKSLLEREADIKLVGQACDGLEVLKLARELQPDLVVTDLSMPGLNGIETIRRLRGESPQMRVLCLSVHDEARMVLAVIDAGAGGYVLKDASFQELVQAIRRVMADQIYLSSDLVGIVVEQYRNRHAPQPAAAASPLTPRERELVQLFSEGHSTQQIAERLHLSAKTVATHRENIMGKLHIHSIAELTRFALREGLSSLDAPCRAPSTERRAKPRASH
ncbi:MAG TPA: response regulator transcription factor [Rhizobacter sp.]|nr:response regulator transcription factor [Rhizobacter sp.]